MQVLQCSKDDRNDEIAGDEVFVHYSAINAVQSSRGGFRSLMEGEILEYNVVRGPKGWQAQNVTGPGGVACIGAPPVSSSAANSASKAASARKFSMTSVGSVGYDMYGMSPSGPRRPGHDSGYYSSSALTSPLNTPHQPLYPLPQFPFYPGSPPYHTMAGPPFAFMGAPPPYGLISTSPDDSPHVFDGALVMHQPGSDDSKSPYRPLPSSTFYPAGPGIMSPLPPHPQSLAMSPISGPVSLPPGALGYYPIANANDGAPASASDATATDAASPPLYPIPLTHQSPRQQTTNVPVSLPSPTGPSPSAISTTTTTTTYYNYPISGAHHNAERRRKQSVNGLVVGVDDSENQDFTGVGDMTSAHDMGL
ncbi:hypothetical protein OIO90_004475 [Microbotryomycetes sp. JL221]|nr:hypothetical protein OIO90_004475 [Microbotryomycetes sp. JL221]